MISRFAFEPTAEGLVVRLDTDPPASVRDWTTWKGSPTGTGTLLRLRDDGAAREMGDRRSLLVAWSAVAGLSSDELQHVGLPDASPFVLEVAATGAIHDADFEPRYGFIRSGRRLLGASRVGAWLRVSGSSFVLLDPIHAITEAIDTFRSIPDASVEQRMLYWGRIAELLPDDAVVDDRLNDLRIVVASTFELDPSVNEHDEPDFDPVIGQLETTTNATGEEEQRFNPGLPPARQRDFADYFRRFGRVLPRYPVGGSVYVMLTPEVERALGAVHRAQRATPEERRDFLLTPAPYLRQALDLGGDLGAETTSAPVDVDTVFWDHGLSDRVRGVGVWERKVLPWIRRAGEPWLPPEQLGLQIGDQAVPLEPAELPNLRERIQRALERGSPVVEVRGVELPATPQSLEAVEQLLGQAPPVQKPLPKDAPGSTAPNRPEAQPDDLVLQIRDNLEEVHYRTHRQRRVPGIQGVPLALRSTLYAHQQAALDWLSSHWEAGSRGSLLADDMGLGKTLEALAFLYCVKNAPRSNGAGPILVVAPTGLLQNWVAEHDTHLERPGLGHRVEAHGRGLRDLRRHGSGKEIREAAATGVPLQLLDVERLRKADWVLTTYETLRDYQHSFGRVRWCAAVFDEAHKMKNPGAKLTEAALAMNVDFALLLTGTPVENRPADVWSLLDRVAPGRAGTLKDFSRRFETRSGDEVDRLNELRKLLIEPSEPEAPELMLRRLKEDHVKGLPDKHIVRQVVCMPAPQAEAYERVVEHGRRVGSDARSRKGGILEVLQKLRSTSLHPARPGEGGKSDDIYIGESARLSAAFRTLDQIACLGDKALLFVESLSMQSFLIGALRRRFALPEDPLVINGAIAGRIRKQRVDMFQQRGGFDVMVLSPRAGGVGLTLTAANHVIHLSRWWNPAVEDQCTDRAHRIGQKRRVKVYLPLARHPRLGDHSFDLKLDLLLARKRAMNRSVLAPVAPTQDELRDLYEAAVVEPGDEGAPSDAPPADEDTATHRRSSAHDVDLLDPIAFERWVLRELAAAGYEPRQTPPSGDRGADGLLFWRGSGTPHTLIVQCKRLDPGRKCGDSAVREVLNALRAYEIEGEAVPMVVTSGAGFTRGAQHLARRERVRLVDRGDLDSLHRWRI